jgi:hypothetical protein
VQSPNWHGNRGAATWGSGTKGTSGVVSGNNSLIGSSKFDSVGFDVLALSNGNYVVDSPFWNGNRGAATWGNGKAGVTGAITALNSLVGSHANDYVGGSLPDPSIGVGAGNTALANGNYVVQSPNWNNGRGAATWGNGAKGTRGVVSAANSLVGTTGGTSGDNVGYEVLALSNGNYVVSSAGKGKGAATWVDGTNGATLDGGHTIDAQNSILPGGANLHFSSASPGTLPGSFLAIFADNSGGGTIAVGITNPNQLTFALGQSRGMTVAPAFLTRSLDAGTAVDLQASSTLTISSPIAVSAHGHGGNLTLEAGGTVLLDAGINTDGGALKLSGTVSPGGSKPALVHLAARTVSFKPHSSYTIQLNSTTAGKGYDQLQVNGGIKLAGATLALGSVGHFGKGQTFILVQSSKPIIGTFAGLAEGGSVHAGGQALKISYKNDKVTLIVQ